MSESVEKSSEVTLVTDGCFCTRRGLEGKEWDASLSSWISCTAGLGDLPTGRHSSSERSPPELSDMRTCLLEEREEQVTLLVDTLDAARSTELRSLHTDSAWLVVVMISRSWLDRDTDTELALLEVLILELTNDPASSLDSTKDDDTAEEMAEDRVSKEALLLLASLLLLLEWVSIEDWVPERSAIWELLVSMDDWVPERSAILELPVSMDDWVPDLSAIFELLVSMDD